MKRHRCAYVYRVKGVTRRCRRFVAKANYNRGKRLCKQCGAVK